MQLYTLLEFAKMIKKSKSYVYHNWRPWAIKAGVKPLIVGGRPRLRETDIEKMLKSFEIDI